MGTNLLRKMENKNYYFKKRRRNKWCGKHPFLKSINSVHSSISLKMGSIVSAKKSTIYPHPENDTNYGKIQGKHYILPNGKSTSIFLGIPFAKPPIGELRFKKPELPDPWKETLTCQKYKSRSIQKDFIWDTVELRTKKSEDCLYLNIMKPDWKLSDEDELFPVMIYIHGGGFVMDSSVKYHYTKICKNIVSKNVIVVTIQYRLGYLGYFSTDDDVSIGNYGLWDQYYALKFVKENIKHFNGNPDNITLFGQSAGAVSCDLLSLSPYSRDLFDKMILMAGNAETVWSVSPRCRVARNCRQKAVSLGFKKPSSGNKWTKEDNIEMLKFMKNISADKLGLTMIGMTDIFESMQLTVTPVIDGDFLPKSLTELRKEAPKKTVITGNCQHEGLLFLALGMKQINKKLLKYVKLRASNLILEGNALVPKNEQITFKSWEELYGLQNISNLDKKSLRKVVVNLISDTANGIAHYILCNKLIENGSTVYSYNFQHYNSQSMQSISFYLPFLGPTHCSEINTLFDINVFVGPYVRTQEDKKMTQLMSLLLTNFAKTGDPNSYETKNLFKWKPLDVDNPERYLAIKPNPESFENLDHDRYVKQAIHFNVIHEMMTLVDEDDYTEFSIGVKDLR